MTTVAAVLAKACTDVGGKQQYEENVTILRLVSRAHAVPVAIIPQSHTMTPLQQLGLVRPDRSRATCVDMSPSSEVLMLDRRPEYPVWVLAADTLSRLASDSDISESQALELLKTSLEDIKWLARWCEGRDIAGECG